MAKLGSNGIRVNQASIIEEQAARINELEADLAQSEICIRARMDVIDEQAARIKELEAGWAKEKAQNLLNFQRHDEGETRSWDDLSEDQQQARIEFADRCIRAESKIAELNTAPDGEDDI